MLLIAVIDRLIPSFENPHELRKIEDIRPGMQDKNQRLMRMGLFTALAIGIHNFPEGLATFMAALTKPELGIAIAVAIAIHNIPEELPFLFPFILPPVTSGKLLSILFFPAFRNLSEPWSDT